ncbi:hypothetical protein GGI04_006162, partial [Coemansia thaxteri]
PDLDTDDTEAAASDADADAEGVSDADSGCEGDDQEEALPSPNDLVFSRRFYGENISTGYLSSGQDGYNDDSGDNENEAHVADLRSAAAACFRHAAYQESIGSGSISSSLSPSSTLSASPMAAASSTPDQPADIYMGERLDAEDLSLLVSMPKPDLNRLNLLRLCVDVLRETNDVDEIVGWIDLRVWRALSAWFLNHPHNNMLHIAVYQLIAIVTLETIRLRRTLRRQTPDLRKLMAVAEPSKALFEGAPSTGDGYDGPAKGRGNVNSGSALLSAGDGSSGASTGGPEANQQATRAQAVARRRARRRRAMAERIRREES